MFTSVASWNVFLVCVIKYGVEIVYCGGNTVQCFHVAYCFMCEGFPFSSLVICVGGSVAGWVVMMMGRCSKERLVGTLQDAVGVRLAVQKVMSGDVTWK